MPFQTLKTDQQLSDIPTQPVSGSEASQLKERCDRLYELGVAQTIYGWFTQFQALYDYYVHELWRHGDYGSAAEGARHEYHISTGTFYGSVRAWHELCVLRDVRQDWFRGGLQNKTSLYDIAWHLRKCRLEGVHVTDDELRDWCSTRRGVEELRRHLADEPEPTVAEVAERELMDTVDRYRSVLTERGWHVIRVDTDDEYGRSEPVRAMDVNSGERVIMAGKVKCPKCHHVFELGNQQ